MIRVDKNKLLHGNHLFSVCWDVFMLFIISINLTWLILDVILAHPVFNNILLHVWPAGHNFYEQILHPQFPRWDLAFVVLYLIEIVWCWIRSIIKKTYYRWWFYPFVHWYDVLGCIPISGFRFLRLFRLVSLLYRLQHYGILDFSQTFIARFFKKYLAVIIEEVSDRVVIRVLEGFESELRAGNPVTHRVMTQVIAPRRYQLGAWLGDRLTDVIEHSYFQRQPQVFAYLRGLVHVAVKQNAEVARLARVPGLGRYFSDQLEQAIADITNQVLAQLAEDLHGEQSTGLIHEASDILFKNLSEPGGDLSNLVKGAILDFLEVIKEEVAVQKWKESPTL